MSDAPDPNDPRLPVLTPELLAKADVYSQKLVEQLPKIDPLDLADVISELTQAHLDYLMNREEKTVEHLLQVASQLGWWNVLLIVKLREIALESFVESNGLIVPPGDGIGEAS